VMTLEKARNIIEARMDGAWLGSIDIAINKAFTAKAFDISTGIAKAKQIGQPMNIAVVDAGANLTAFVRQ
jgi:uncharacterized protein GlcG (DUF336 family)